MIYAVALASVLSWKAVSSPSDTVIGAFECSITTDMMTDVVSRNCTVAADTTAGTGHEASLTLARNSKGTWSRVIRPSRTFEHYSADKHAARLPRNMQYGFPPMQCIFRIDQGKPRDEFCMYEAARKTLESTYSLGGFRMNSWKGDTLLLRINTHWTSEDVRFPMKGWENVIMFLSAAKASR
jgi:hypothetical protein